MRTILIIVLGLFIAQSVKAQVDSLIIKLDDYGHMIIISPNLVTEKHESFGLNDSYRKFYTDFESIDKSRFNDKNQIIKYNIKKYEPDQRTIYVEVADKQDDVFYFQGEAKQLLLASKFRLELDAGRKVIVLVDSIQYFGNLVNVDLDSLYIQSLSHFQAQNPKKSIPYILSFSSIKSKIDENSLFIRPGKCQSQIYLYTNFGMSIINSIVAPEIGLNLDFDLYSKGKSPKKFGINSTFLFIPDKNDFFNINTYRFVNLKYSVHFMNEWNHQISIGYLYNKNGNDFNGKTWCAAWKTQINHLGFKIGGYYTKNLNNAYTLVPSVGIDFGF